MALKTKVKVGNITNLSDARYCAGMGVDFLGFPVDTESGQGVSMDSIKEITGWVSGPEFVLEVRTRANLDALKEYYALFIFQIPVSLLSDQAPLPPQLIVRLDNKDWDLVKSKYLEIKSDVRFILLSMGSDQGVDKLESQIREIAPHFPVLLHFNFDRHLDQVLTWPIAGIALLGSNEAKPGFKEYGKLSEVLEQLEAE